MLRVGRDILALRLYLVRGSGVRVSLEVPLVGAGMQGWRTPACSGESIGWIVIGFVRTLGRWAWLGGTILVIPLGLPVRLGF